MVRKSSELAAVLKRVLVAFESRDVATIRSLIAQTEDTLIVGSDAREWRLSFCAAPHRCSTAHSIPDAQRRHRAPRRSQLGVGAGPMRGG